MFIFLFLRQRSSEGFSPEPKRARRSISIEYNCYNPSLISICHILSSLNNFIKKFSSKLRRLYEKCVAFGNNENAQNELVINRLNWYLLWDIAKKLKKRLLNELLTKRCEADMTRVVVDIQKLLFKYPKRQKIKMNSVSLENVPTDVTQSTLEESSFTSGQTHDTKESKEVSKEQID